MGYREEENMTERQKQLLKIMEHCVLNGEFCDNCPNKDSDYEGCHATHMEFMAMVRESWEGEKTNNEGTTADHTGECQGTAQH